MQKNFIRKLSKILTILFLFYGLTPGLDFAQSNVYAATTLNAGDLAVVGCNALTDTIKFVALADISSGTVINITDRGWADNDAFNTSAAEGILTWTLGQDVSKGTVFSLFLGGNDQPSTLKNLNTNESYTTQIVSSGWTSTTDPMILSGDSIFIFTGSNTNPYFIFGFNTSIATPLENGWNTAATSTAVHTSKLPNGTGSQNALTSGINAIGIDPQMDNCQYTGSVSATTASEWSSRISNSSNWSGDNTGITSSAINTFITIQTPNTAPAFVGSTTAQIVNQDSINNDIKKLLHVSDSDSGQTLTWSQSSPPSNGTLSFSGATATSGVTDITPDGTITYTPTDGYFGNDSFTVQVSDGTDTATRTIDITVNEVQATPTPTFNPVAGAVAFGTPLQIICAGAEHIYYTTNGSDPATSVTGATLEYNDSSRPTISSTMTIKAIATKAGILNSDIASASYIQAETADLTTLGLSGTPGNYTFAGGTYNYNGVTVANGVDRITVTPVGAGIITVEGTPVVSGAASVDTPLIAGVEKTITVIATETGKSAKTYVISITRANPSNSKISPSMVFFDKNTWYQANVTTTMTLNGNTLSSITNGGTPLVLNTNYTVSGNTVTIKKEYLAAQGVGTTNLTFNFSAGNTQTLAVTVSDTTTFIFDYEANVSGFGSKTVTQMVGGEVLRAVSVSQKLMSNNSLSLMGGSEGTDSLATDYSSGSEISITFSLQDGKVFDLTSINFFDWSAIGEGLVITSSKGQINTDPIPDFSTTFNVSAQADAAKFRGITSFAITAQDGAIEGMSFDNITLMNIINPITPALNSTINPATRSFDKNTSSQADVITIMTLNGNTLSSVTNGGTQLVLNTNYTVSGNTVTIKKEYLAAQGVGTTNLTFNFSAGNTQTLAVNVSDTTPAIPYTLTYTGGVNGNITGTTVQTVNHGLNGTEVEAVPNAGYHFVKWSDNVATAKRTDSNVLGNISVTATFAINEYTLSYSAGANGSITGTKIQTVNHGLNGTEVEAVPNAGYHFVKWSDNVATAKRTDSNVIENISVTATFAINEYTLSYSAGANGSITGTIVQTVNHGLNGTEVEAVPNAGYHFVSWSDGKLTASRTDSNVSGNVNVTASFVINNYTVNFNVDGGSAVDSQTINYNEKASKPSEPTKAGYTFRGWYTDSTFVTEFDFANTAITKTTIVYAKWTINSYAVSFNVNGGSAVNSQSIDYNAKATKPAVDPTKTGYTFGGWYADSNCTTAFDFATKLITEGTTVYAKWTINSYAVNFNVDGGSAVASQSINYNGKATKPSVNPTKTGYTFGGWYADSNCTTVFDFATKLIEEATTVYAKWTINSYAVSFNVNGGSAVNSQSINYNAKVTRPAVDPIKTGYTFENWYTDSNCTTAFDFATKLITGATTVYAKWTINSYAVSFNVNGGSAVDSQSINYNGKATKPAVDPTKTGYTFGGWHADSNCTTAFDFATKLVTEATTVYAKWTIDSYAVNFNVDGGSVVDSQTINYNGKATKPAVDPTKTGYTFRGWYTVSTFVTEFDFANTAITKATIVYAKWTINSYAVSFNVKGGSAVDSQSINYNGKATKPAVDPTNTGYTFGGWYADSNCTTAFDFANIAITGATTVYAKWTINSYAVNFNVDGGSAVDSQSINYNGKANKPSVEPTKTGYTFGGWYAESNCTTAFDFSNKLITEATTVYAKWTINQYAVTFNVDGGSAVNSQSINYNAKATKPAVDPTKIGYTFGGWYADSNCTTAFDFANTAITGVTTVYAKWTINQYAVTFNVDGGSTVDSQTINYNGKATKPAVDPTKTGYTFGGWYADSNCTTEFDFANTAITGVTTVYAKWTINNYAVSFNVDGGSAVESQSINYNAKATRPAVDPTKTGYTFVGWYADSNCTTAFDFANTAITGVTTVYAKWTINSYAVSFNVDGGSAVASQSINYNGKATKPAVDPTKAGYTFRGWYTDSTFVTEFDFANTAITKTTIVYAKWLSALCDITTWTVPSTPTVTGLDVAKAVTNGTTSIIVAVTASADATWKLYSDVACTTEITNKTMALSVGANTAYVKVTAQDTTTSKVYTLTVTRAAAEYNGGGYTPPTPSVETEVITVDVTNGDAGNAISKTTIERTTESNGTITDRVEYKKESAQQTVDQLKKSGGDTARIVIPDKKDKVSEVKVTIPKVTLNIIAQNNVNLEIDTENARIILPNESIQNLEENLFFRLLPIKGEEKQQEIKERAKNEEVIKQVAGDSDISVIGRPMTIETNMSQREVDIILPLKDIAIPKDPKERAAFLKRLGVFIEHSDGEKVLARAELVEFKDGILGLKFRINKFSTFTIIEFPENVPSFDGETLIIEQKINLNQGWTIEFSNDADQGTVTQSSIYITDSKGKIHNTNLTAAENVVNVKLMENYRANETYYLCITKTIKSRTGKVLIKSVRYKFNTSQLSK